MTTQTCNPLTARSWFQYREPVNWALTIIVFIPCYFILLQVVGGFLAAVISMALAFCLLFLLLSKRSIGIVCANHACRKFIDTNTPWICGNKGCRNDHGDEFPFIYKCEHCGYFPKAYKCHHCGELVYFTKDRQQSGYAECANDMFRPQQVKKRGKHTEKVITKKEQIEIKELNVRKADQELELKRRKEALSATKSEPKTAEEELEAFLKSSVGDEDVAQKWRARVEEQFKDDELEREKRLQLIDKWAMSRLK